MRSRRLPAKLLAQGETTIQRSWLRYAYSLAVLGSALGAGGGVQAIPPPMRIQPLGDSITYGHGAAGGYRLPLYQLLTNAGFNVDFVGTQTGNGAPSLPDLDHEGHSGYRIDQIQAGFLGWADAAPDPDIILLLIGTNDYGQNYDTPNAANRLDQLISWIITNRPNARLIVANVLLRTDHATTDSAIQTTLNPAIPTLVANHAGRGQPVYFQDLRSALGAADLFDGLHPNQSGYKKMAVNWFGAITNLITPLGTTNAPTISHIVSDPNWTNIIVTFSKPVLPDATNLANFSVSGGLKLLGATLDPVGQRVLTLFTTLQTPGQPYTLIVNDVRDLTSDSRPIAPGTAATFQAALTRGAFNNVPEAADYTLIYSLAIPNSGSLDLTSVPYTVDYHYSIPSFSRLAYYLELQPTFAPLQYVWVSMDAFTTDAGKIGLPTTASAAVFQRYVTNLTVFSNVTGVSNVDRVSGGYLEFWPNTYAAKNSAGITGASSTLYDWGDQVTTGRYGSMQVHNVTARQTLFAFNHWATGGAILDLGIGNGTGVNPDWTFAANASSYSAKTLQVFVLPLRDTTAPQLLKAVGMVGRTNALIRFNESLGNSASNPSNYTLSGTVTVTAAVLQSNLRDVLLTTSSQTPNATYTVVVTGVADGSANVLASGSTHFEAVPDLSVFSRVPEASGFRLVYGLGIPTSNPRWHVSAVDYAVDETPVITEPFDRIAYYLELAPSVGGTTNWVYVSADAFTPEVDRIGIPTLSSGAIFQQRLTNLSVFSSVSNLVQGSALSGNIEFWPFSYVQANALGIPNASDSTFDFGDQIGDTTATSGYGSMQIHNFAASQTLFAINHWGNADSANLDLGIGNAPGANPDWTFLGNAANNSVKNLFVLVHPNGAASPSVAPVLISQPRSRTNVVGSAAALVATAVGHPLVYQWRLNGVPLAGQTESALVFPSVNTGDAGRYDLVVSNVIGRVASLPATLTVVTPPDPNSLRSQLTSSNGVIRLTFTGTHGLTYQVRRATQLPATNWVLLFSTNLSPAATFEYLDLEPPSNQAFYQLWWQPPGP